MRPRHTVTGPKLSPPNGPDELTIGRLFRFRLSRGVLTGGRRSLCEIFRAKIPEATTSPATQCRSNPFSGRGLPKTGIFQILAGDYRVFRAGSGQKPKFAKARRWRAFLRISGTPSPRTGLPGWRRSEIRTNLHAISLLTGNLTGKIAIFGFGRLISM